MPNVSMIIFYLHFAVWGNLILAAFEPVAIRIILPYHLQFPDFGILYGRMACRENKRTPWLAPLVG